MFCRRILSTGLALYAGMTACEARAQEVVAPSPIIVTATRTPETADSALVPVTVITRAQIERSQATSLSQLLAGLPGVQLSSNGAFGKTTSLYLRGTNSNQVLVLIDGVRVGSSTTGDTSWSLIPLAQIERIEIVRGPLSSLYGSDAVGGVIQIFTRHPTRKTHVTADVGGGTYGTGEASAGVTGMAGTTGYSLAVSRLQTNGYDVQQNNVPSGYGYNTPDQPGNDGYHNTAVSASLTRAFDGSTRASAHFFRAQGQTQYAGFSSNATDFVRQAAGTSLLVPVTGRWLSKFALGTSADDDNDLYNGVHVSTFDSNLDTASWQNDLVLSSHQDLMVGSDYSAERVSSNAAFTLTHRHDTGVFAMDQIHLGKNRVQLSARRDDNSSYGSHGTGALAWGYRFTQALRLTASYGTAFDAPTFDDLYYPGFGNPNLSPERSHSTDVGLHGRLVRGEWEVHAFRTDISDLIVFVGPGFFPENAAQAQIDGLESSYLFHQGPWRMHAALTVLDPRDQQTGTLLPRRSRESGRIDIDRKVGEFRFGTTVYGQSYSYDDTANTIRLGGFSLFDLRASYRLSRTLTLDTRLDNVFDKQYQTAYTYVEPGRTAFVSLRYAGG